MGKPKCKRTRAAVGGGRYIRDIDTYEAVDIHPVRVRLSAGCTLYFKRIEIGGVGSVEGEEVGYAMCGFFWCVRRVVGEEKREQKRGGRMELLPCKICC